MSKDHPTALTELLRHIRNSGIEPGTVMGMEVLHDDDCPALTSDVPILDCRCKPDFKPVFRMKKEGV